MEKATYIAQFVEIENSDDRDRAVCEWAARCYENARTVSLRTQDKQSADRLDALLWTFDDILFIPHKIYDGSEVSVAEPVLIFTEGVPAPQQDVLLDAAGGAPCPDFRDFRHVIDFADLFDEQLKTLSRQRYKTYHDAGYKMKLIRNNSFPRQD